MSHGINNYVLARTNPYINKAFHVLMITHDVAVLRISIPGPSQNLTSSSVTCTVANVKIKLSLTLEAAFSKRSQVTCLSAPL